jgi:hypothetical protein
MPINQSKRNLPMILSCLLASYSNQISEFKFRAVVCTVVDQLGGQHEQHSHGGWQCTPRCALTLGSQAHGFAESHESLDPLLCIREQIIRRAPRPWFAKYNNG